MISEELFKNVVVGQVCEHFNKSSNTYTFTTAELLKLVNAVYDAQVGDETSLSTAIGEKLAGATKTEGEFHDLQTQLLSGLRGVE